MKTKRVLLLMVLCAAVCVQCFSQSTIGRQKVDQYPITAWNSMTYGLTWLPTDYDSTTDKYPLLIFLHGSGEGGDGVSGLYNLLNTGLPQIIANGFDPQAVNPADGHLYKFIVVSPQAPSAAHWSYAWGSIQWILPDVISRYRIDTSRIYVTGLSAGGAGTWSCVTNGPEAAKKFAAVVPVSAAGTNTSAEADQLPLVGGTYGDKVWNICGANDSWLSFAQNATNTINTATPAPLVPALLTAIPNAGHDPSAWNTAYDPNWRTNAQNLNIYEWMLQYNRSAGSISVNAGTDQDDTLPSQANLSGSVTTTGGATVTSYTWSQVSGPSAHIDSPATVTTTVSGLTAGTFVFRLTVTDNLNNTASDDVTVTVHAAANLNPVSQAGPDLSVTLPEDSVLLTGSGSDADGTITAYQWSKLSGPDQFVIEQSALSQTRISHLVQGSYLFGLTVTDNSGATASDTVSVTVNAAPNQLPVAMAGNDIIINLPMDSALLQGSGTDADGNITAYAWTELSGPSQSVIASPASSSTLVNGLVAGTYVFQLKVTDDSAATAFDTLSVTVNPAPNQLPVAIAGNDITINLPMDSALLQGSGTDADGNITSYEWTELTGPSQSVIASPASSSTLVNGLVAGTYIYQLKVTDDSAATAYDTVSVTVNPAPNQLPVAIAGNDITINLPMDSALLQGSGTDADGNITAYEWTELSGPSQSVITSPASSSTLVNGLVAGTYIYQLKVTDDSAATAYDTVSVIVNPAPNQLPVAVAGNDQTINLPMDSALLQGSGADADGNITAYAWTELSGPSQSVIASPASSSTIVNGLVAGTYIFQLKVTDDSGATSMDTLNINVVPENHCHGVKRYIIPGSDGGKYINANDPNWTMPVNPGDTLVLRSQYAYSYFSMENYSGTAACPIVITNEGGQVWLTAGIETKSCKYLKITGSGNEGTYYGFRVYNPGNDGSGVALTVTGKAKNVEIERVDVYKKTYGVWAKQDPLCDTSFNYPNYTMDSIEIHHCRFKNIGQDCIYAGNTDPLGQRDTWCNGIAQHYIPMRLSNVNLHHLIIDSCNRTGIQVSGVETGYNQVHDNTITRCGYEYNQQQGTGISIGGMTRNCHVYNNTVSNTFLYGILSFGAGTNYIENNRIDSTGWLDGIPNTNSRPCNILASPKTTIPFDSTRIIIRNNRLGLNATTDSTNIALVVWGPATWAVNNVLCSNTKLDAITPAKAFVDPTINYINDCSMGLPNMAPSAFAGRDLVLPAGTDTAILHGSGIDYDGTIVSWQWSKISGPSGGTPDSPSQATSVIRNLVPGSYIFRLTIMDDDSLSASDDILVSVAPPNIAPLANAGPDQSVTLPLNSVILNGSGSDADGTIAAYQWSVISGPAGYTITAPANPNSSVNNLIQGIYLLRLRVTDNSGAEASDTVKITVNAAPPVNMVPVAQAGPDQSITLPNNSVTLSGSGSDADGSITSYQWNMVSGPASYTIASSTQAQTNVSGLVQGTYLFQLIVTDNSGATGRDTVIITVNAAANIAPVADAGNPVIITLPVNTVTLHGSGTDQDGTITSNQWRKIGGPVFYNIADQGNGVATVSGLIQGHYQFELKVTDNQGATGKDTVEVTVNAATTMANRSPQAYAGADREVSLPTNQLTLNGSGSDPDGLIIGYSWKKISGPSQYTIDAPSQAQTSISNLAEGTYQFELSVTDNQGAVSKDTIQVKVLPDLRMSSNATVYPNPAHSNINLKIDAITHRNQTSIRIYDARGSIVYQETFLRNQQVMVKTVDISKLLPGVYFITVNVDINKDLTLKIIKD